MIRTASLGLFIFFILLVLAAIYSLGIGSEHLAWPDLFINSWGHDETQQFILLELRLPRILAAILAGIALGTSGALVQGVVRNPLAAPDMLGITGGASVAWLGVLLLFPETPTTLMPWTAFFGGILAYALVMLLNALIKGSVTELTLIGIAVSVFSGSLLKILTVKYPMKINAGLAWLNGSLWGSNWDTLKVVWFPIVSFFILAWIFAKSLDVLRLGEETATHLGLSVPRVRKILLFSAVALGSVAVTLSGTIGFVGLVAPHLARRLLGYRHAFVLPGAALIGALLTVIADMIARGVWQPLELPTGLFTAIIGAPYLLYLLARTGRSSL